MTKYTHRQVREIAKNYPNITIRYAAEWEVWMVYPKGQPNLAYESDDASDAIDTMRTMAEHISK